MEKNVTPDTLVKRLQESGQANANRRFWLLILPALSLISIINIVLAWQNTSPAHAVWMTSSLLIFANRIISFSYFVPTMIRKFGHPEKIDPERLKKMVQIWTLLSPIRILVELSAWGLALWVLVSLVEQHLNMACA